MMCRKSLVLVLCALLAAVSGCGTGGGGADNATGAGAENATTDVDRKTTEADFTNSIGMKFNLIPAGEFMMGSPEDEAYLDDESPVHLVRITKPFYLGVYEVTQGQWEAVMNTRPWEGMPYTKSRSEHAVSHVSWEDAIEFCEKLSALEGREYRLPTEAEWEYGCRAGTTTRFNFGDDYIGLRTHAWCGGTVPVDEKYPHGVGLKCANAWGLHDMHGNVYEWCQDWYDGDYYKDSPTDDPAGPSTGSKRVSRGGAWGTGSISCMTCAYRSKGRPDHGGMGNGFRVAAVPPEGTNQEQANR